MDYSLIHIDIKNFYYFSDSINMYNYFKLIYWFIDYYNIIVIGKNMNKNTGKKYFYNQLH